MHAQNFDLQAYFSRIGYAGPSAPTLANVAAIMRRQLLTVPFENLDVQAGKTISLVPEDIVTKIVGRHRGGYCYEVNGLFAMVLQALGVPYQLVAARPMFYPVRRPRTHMVLVAMIEGRPWLCDLGFGSYGIRAPMALDLLDTAVAQDHDTFRLTMEDPRHYLLQALVDGEWSNQFGFDLSEQEWIDFAPANFMNSHHPDAIFVKTLLVVLHTDEGRLILMGDELKTVSGGQRVTRTLAPGEREGVLRELFKLQTAA